MACSLTIKGHNKKQSHERTVKNRTKGFTKVRTGCATCKARRVKCDESRPQCNRCLVAGRVCDGYPTPPPPKRRLRRSKYDCEDLTTLVQRNPDFQRTLGSVWVPNPSRDPTTLARTPLVSIDPGVDSHESQRLYYLRTKVADDICGYFEKDFWNRLILQVSSSDETIRHAVLALSSLYESFEVSEASNDQDRAYSLKRFALQHYNQATKSLCDRLSSQQVSLQLVLTSCFLFVWLEFLQNNLSLAYNHLRGGIRILTENAATFRSEDPDGHLVRAFSRLNIQASMHGAADKVTPFNAIVGQPQPMIHRVFTTVTSARQSLDIEMNLLAPLRILAASETRPPSHTHATLEKTCQIHLFRWQAWFAAFEPLSSKPHHSLISRSNLSQMEIIARTAIISLSALFAPSPTAYDAHTDDFLCMVNLAREVLNDRVQRRHVMGLPFTTGLLRPLCFVAMRCWATDVRTRAVALLERCEERGGLAADGWAGRREEVLKLCRWKIGVEDAQGAFEGGMVPEEKRIFGERVEEKVGGGKYKTDVVVRFKRRLGEAIVEEEAVVEGLSQRLVGFLD